MVGQVDLGRSCMDGRVDLGWSHMDWKAVYQCIHTLLKLLLNFMMNISKVSGEKICNFDWRCDMKFNTLHYK